MIMTRFFFYLFFLFSLVYSTETSNISKIDKPKYRVLFFDTFGTVLAQRKPVADELWKAAQKALESNTSSINGGVRDKAMKMVRLSELSTHVLCELTCYPDIRAVVRVGRGQ
jgi:hypothetical protein